MHICPEIFQPAPESCSRESYPLHDAGRAVHPSAREGWQKEVTSGAVPQPHCQPGSEHPEAAPSKAELRGLLWMNAPSGFFGNGMDRGWAHPQAPAPCSPYHNISQGSSEKSGPGPWWGALSMEGFRIWISTKVPTPTCGPWPWNLSKIPLGKAPWPGGRSSSLHRPRSVPVLDKSNLAQIYFQRQSLQKSMFAFLLAVTQPHEALLAQNCKCSGLNYHCSFDWHAEWKL